MCWWRTVCLCVSDTVTSSPRRALFVPAGRQRTAVLRGEVRNDAPDKLTPGRQNPAGSHGTRWRVMRATTTGHDEGGTSYRHEHA